MNRQGRGFSSHRRTFLRLIAGGGAFGMAGCAHHHAALTCDQATLKIERLPDFEGEVSTIGPLSGRTVVLLHELPGMYDATVGLARCLASRGFTVYLPLLFGTVGAGQRISRLPAVLLAR